MMSRAWPPKKAEFTTLVERHMSQSQIAARYAVPKGWVAALAKRWGVQWRNRSGGRIVMPKVGCLPWPPEAKDLREMAARGMNQREIAARYNASCAAVSEQMTKPGVMSAGALKRQQAAERRAQKEAAARAARERSRQQLKDEIRRRREARAPVVEAVVPLQAAVPTFREAERARVAAILAVSPYRDITAAERAMLKAKFPPPPVSERRRDWASLHDPARAA